MYAMAKKKITKGSPSTILDRIPAIKTIAYKAWLADHFFLPEDLQDAAAASGGLVSLNSEDVRIGHAQTPEAAANFFRDNHGMKAVTFDCDISDIHAALNPAELNFDPEPSLSVYFGTQSVGLQPVTYRRQVSNRSGHVVSSSEFPDAFMKTVEPKLIRLMQAFDIASPCSSRTGRLYSLSAQHKTRDVSETAHTDGARSGFQSERLIIDFHPDGHGFAYWPGLKTKEECQNTPPQSTGSGRAILFRGDAIDAPEDWALLHGISEGERILAHFIHYRQIDVDAPKKEIERLESSGALEPYMNLTAN